MVMQLALFWNEVMMRFGLGRSVVQPVSFVSQLSFAPPSRWRTGWHYFVQPMRESNSVLGKTLSLLGRSEAMAIVLFFLMAVFTVLASVFVAMWFVLDLFELSMINFSFSTAIAIIAVAAGSLKFASMLNTASVDGGLVVWIKRRISGATYYGTRVPNFVIRRIQEVEQHARFTGVKVEYELYETTQDPILVAYVSGGGKTEKFTVAVFDYGSEQPLCE